MLPIQRVLDMPIKFPGSPEYRLPAELEALVPLVRKVVDFEHSVNDTVLDSYCYLTLEQGIVRAGTMQRNEGCHTDGFQGSRIQPKLSNPGQTIPTLLAMLCLLYFIFSRLK